jgi:carbon storage regulator
MHEMKKVLGNLVLTRGIGQSIMIGDEIEIMIGKFNGSQVVIAINAPKHIVVHRKEVWERIKAQQNARQHDCADHAEYHIGRVGVRIATCEMCGSRWSPDEDEE